MTEVQVHNLTTLQGILTMEEMILVKIVKHVTSVEVATSNISAIGCKETTKKEENGVNPE